MGVAANLPPPEVNACQVLLIPFSKSMFARFPGLWHLYSIRVEKGKRVTRE
jgi:hypothetical protein